MDSIRVSRKAGHTRHSQDTAEEKREDLTEEDLTEEDLTEEEATYANAITKESVNGWNFPVILKTETIEVRKLTTTKQHV